MRARARIMEKLDSTCRVEDAPEYKLGRLAGLREAAVACQRLSRTNRQSSPLTSYVEGRADAGEACAGLILALAGETT